MKIVFFHGITAGVSASAAAIIYSKVYFFSTGANFSKVVNPAAITGLNLIAALLACLAYHLLSKRIKRNKDIWFNLGFTVLTFTSFLAPLLMVLPLNIPSPELFIGLVIPMHVFPQLLWLTSKPLFEYEN